MNRIRVYIKEVREELFTKVTWPTWSELQESAVIVMVATLIFAVVVFSMDFSFNKLMEILYKKIIN